MRVGLDFDNTLACYHKVFGHVARDQNLVPQDWQGGKPEIREELRSRIDGEEQWQRLQGQVYGKYMHRAELFPEVANFLLRLKRRKDEVFIVSHKTEFGHYDPEKTPLRLEALRWMDTQRFFDEDGLGLKREQVFFASTREEKIEKIIELRCEVFVDDLWEVLSESAFPEITRKVLFGRVDENQFVPDLSSTSWREISRYLLGLEKEEEIQYWIENLVGAPIERLSKVEGRANSQVFGFEKEQQAYAIKWYPDLAFDKRNRAVVESMACLFLKEQGIGSALQSVNVSLPLNLAMYNWIEGSQVNLVKDRDIKQALQFVHQLHENCRSEPAQQIPDAGEACLSLYNLRQQIERKEQNLRCVAWQCPKLQGFLDNEFTPVKRHYQKSLAQQFPLIDLETKLAKKWQTLSPSDFGFHNSIRKADGSLVWLDFEYFGWDDPVKLICDFLWHPGFSLTEKQRRQWWEGCQQIFIADPQLLERLHYCMPLYGLRWCLILLNVFLRDDNKSKWSTKFQHQINKARRWLVKVENLSKTEDQTEIWPTIN